MNSEAIRTLTLASSDAVDFVVVFDENTPYILLEELRADVLVKCGDYRPDEVVGRDLVKEVRIVATLPDHATTKILQR